MGAAEELTVQVHRDGVEWQEAAIAHRRGELHGR